MKKKTYLITGCAGFIGSHLVKKLFRNHKLILVDDLSGGSIINLPKVLRKKLIKKKNSRFTKIKNKKIRWNLSFSCPSFSSLFVKKFFQKQL